MQSAVVNVMPTFSSRKAGAPSRLMENRVLLSASKASATRLRSACTALAAAPRLWAMGALAAARTPTAMEKTRRFTLLLDALRSPIELHAHDVGLAVDDRVAVEVARHIDLHLALRRLRRQLQLERLAGHRAGNRRFAHLTAERPGQLVAGRVDR